MKIKKSVLSGVTKFLIACDLAQEMALIEECAIIVGKIGDKWEIAYINDTELQGKMEQFRAVVNKNGELERCYLNYRIK